MMQLHIILATFFRRYDFVLQSDAPVGSEVNVVYAIISRLYLCSSRCGTWSSAGHSNALSVSNSGRSELSGDALKGVLDCNTAKGDSIMGFVVTMRMFLYH